MGDTNLRGSTGQIVPTHHEFDGQPDYIDVELWLDYVDVVGDRMMVYDPGKNNSETGLDPNGPIPAIAHTEAKTVSCN